MIINKYFTFSMINCTHLNLNNNYFPALRISSISSVCSAALRSIGSGILNVASFSGRTVTSLKEGLGWVFQICRYGYYKIDALDILTGANLMTTETRRAVLGHKDSWNLIDALRLLQEAGLLTAENLAAVLGHRKAWDVPRSLRLLTDEGILTAEFVTEVLGHQNPSFIVQAFSYLQRAGILTAENRAAVLQHQVPFSVVEALRNLQHAGNLTTENLAAVLRHGDLRAVQRAAFLEFLIDLGRRPAAAKNARMDVHEGQRDARTHSAIETFYRSSVTPSQEQIEQAYDEFIVYISTKNEVMHIKALRALNQPRVGQEFGTLVSDESFTYLGREINGKELIARLWNFASNLADENDRINAKDGMVSALVDSYENGSLVCNQGKTQRLIIAVVQGRMEGVKFEGQDFGLIKTADAVTMFFAIVSNQQITELRPLLRAANRFCDQNPNVTRDAFLNEIREYARVEAFPDGQ